MSALRGRVGIDLPSLHHQPGWPTQLNTSTAPLGYALNYIDSIAFNFGNGFRPNISAHCLCLIGIVQSVI